MRFSPFLPFSVLIQPYVADWAQSTNKLTKLPFSVLFFLVSLSFFFFFFKSVNVIICRQGGGWGGGGGGELSSFLPSFLSFVLPVFAFFSSVNVFIC